MNNASKSLQEYCYSQNLAENVTEVEHNNEISKIFEYYRHFAHEPFLKVIHKHYEYFEYTIREYPDLRTCIQLNTDYPDFENSTRQNCPRVSDTIHCWPETPRNTTGC